jgi:hypothetical protein
LSICNSYEQLFSSSPLELVSVIRDREALLPSADRASFNEPLALVGALISQFSILTKANNYVTWAY